MDSQFNELAALYENTMSWPFRRDCEVPTVLNTLGDLSGLDVLDFGCGSGFYSREMKALGARRVVGYDEAEGMLDYCRRREEKQQLGLEFTSSITPQMEGAFDLVLAVYVLPYAADHEALLAMCGKMGSLLKPGGRLVTLPIHPSYRHEPSYYERYGFRLVSDNDRLYQDGCEVILHLIRDPYDEKVTAYYWSADTLERTLSAVGFEPPRWLPHQITEAGLNQLGDAFWEPYRAQPHAGLLECRLQG